MTTTHTQPAGCDLDSLTRYDSYETDDGDDLRVEPDGRWVRFDDVREAIARAAQAPQGDTRQGATVDLSNADLYTLRRVIECVEKMDERPRPMCRDCADENGTCPNSGLECDMGMLITSAKSIYNRLATPAAHTCTPADERTEQIRLAYADPTGRSKAQMVRDVECLLAHIALLRAPDRAAQGAGTAPVASELTVWEGAMPESNGRSNFTAVLHRKDSKGFDRFTDGFQFTRSEYPDRVKYEADFMRWLIGERETKPELWDDCYDMDKHSGYTHPAPVSTAPSKSPEFEGIGDVPVSTAAATTTSTSDVPFFGYFAFHDGEWHPSNVNDPCGIKLFRIAPSRAADGQQDYEVAIEKLASRWKERAVRAEATLAQQGASRAVLDVLDGLPTYDPERDMPGVMEFRDKYHDGDYYKVEDVRAALARAPLPAQADGQAVDDARDAALEEAAKICADADKSTHPAELATAIRAAQSRAQSDTTGDHNA